MESLVIDDRYRLLREIESNDARELHDAEQIASARKVTIELRHAPLEAFLREAKLLSKLEHPSLVYVLDFGTYQGRPCLVRDLTGGETLEQALARGRRFSRSEALPILRQLSEGLAQAHAAGLFHRRLTPSSVILGDRVRLTDFALGDTGGAAVADLEALAAIAVRLGCFNSPEAALRALTSPAREPTLSQELPDFFGKHEEPKSLPTIDVLPAQPTFTKGLWSAAPTLSILIFAVTLGALFWVYVIGLPDPARDARTAVRSGKGASVIMQIEALLANGRTDADLHSALGYALLVQSSSPKKAIKHFAIAAEKDPRALEQSDIAGLVALLGLPGEDTAEVERVLRMVEAEARPWLKITFSAPASSAFLRCRAGEVLRAMGESGIDPVPLCVEAIKPRHCGTRSVLISRLADKRARPALEKVAAEVDYRGEKECGAEAAAQAISGAQK